ncbi:putative diguanylate cyclase YdaM [Lacunisphaera limnophila]|uniref:diguanylate cyclase n=1 Tax=Lacunisphaera limnophila TaxID=1838286 RepID=A0A1D8AR56_9BACT|nr:GGDEF domain-containing protein [Lacunisphaera limnophila]AOS43376.1 putative diguanylate cyclase YdaM [Lacunisphaera limnophila]
MTFSTRQKLFFSHFLAVVLVSGSIGSYFYQSAIDTLLGSLQARLQYSTGLLSRTFSPTELDQLLTVADKDNPAYREGITRLRELVGSNPDIAYIYVLRRTGDKVQFVLDSDPDDPAQPGEIYQVSAPALRNGFTTSSCDRELIHDKWGTFMSGYGPIADSNGRYAIGIDMRADEVENKLYELRRTGILSLALSILLALLFAQMLSRNFLKRIYALHRRCVAMAQGDELSPIGSGDELSQLTATFDDMLGRIQRHHSELEQRVARRTAELQTSNQRLQGEIAERERMAQLLEHNARTDFLTQLINRRAMAQLVQNDLERIGQAGGACALVLVDIDHFKRINDQFGHDIGDDVLKAVARALQAAVREQDVVARWGGEEFLVLLPNTGEAEAVEQAERLRQLLDNAQFRIDRYPNRVTASFGVSEYHHGQTLELLFKQADLALYQAKAQGRNRVYAQSGGAA